MLTPPPVSGDAYPTGVGSETRSNYLRAGLVVTTAYSDNVLGFVEGYPISDFVYSIWPTIQIDKTTSRLHLMLAYSPGFTIYQRTSGLDQGLDQTDQNVTVDFHYRLSPHVTASLRDSLQKTPNALNQPDSLSGATVSGSGQPPLIAVIAPTADMLINGANMQLAYQFSRNGMIGAEGTFANLDYLKPTQVSGLYDSTSSGGAAFYSHRLSGNQYMGATYQYLRILAFPVNIRSEFETQTVLLFYTIYLKPTISFSFSGGPQHLDISQFPVPAYGLWSPTLTASMGWQGQHTNFAANYSRGVSGGGGLVGAFQNNSASASAKWQLARAWSVGAAANYAINKNVTPASFLSTQGGGHSIFGSVSVQHPISEHFNVGVGFTRLHQSYGGIAVISHAPNTDRAFVSVTYLFARPLGR
jgi:hypothetical protein